MKTFSYTFGAGETKTFPSGKFFIAITASNDINVDYFKNNQRMDESATGVQSGYYFESVNGFDTIKIYSATVQTVKIAISRGQGGFNISSTILTGGVLDTITNPLNPDTLDSHFFYTGNSVALQTIVTPAANVNGVLLISGGCIVYNANGKTARLMAKSTAPSTLVDVAAHTLAYAFNGATTQTHNIPIKSSIVPAGVGIYYMSDDATINKCFLEYVIK